MSLINKMLQDLDARGTPAGQSFPSHVMPVAHERRLPSLRMAGIGAGVAAVCVAAAALAWFGWHRVRAAHPGQPAVAAAPLAIAPAAGLNGRITPAPAAVEAPAAKIAPPGAVEAPAPATAAAAASIAAAPVPAVPAPRQPNQAPMQAPTQASMQQARDEESLRPAARRDDEPLRAVASRRDAPARTAAPRTHAHAREDGREDARAQAQPSAATLTKSVLPTEPDSQDARQARHAAAIELATRERRMARLAKLASGTQAGPKGKLETAGRQAAPAQRAEDDYRRALSSLQDGRMAEAVASLQQALRVDPGHDAARQTLVGLLVESGRTDDAIRELQLGLAQDARQPALAMLLARLQIERGGSGIETLQRTLPYAADTTAESAEYRAFLAGALQRQQRHREAVEQYQQALRGAPGNGVWWMGLGISLQADKRNAEALEAFQRARASGSLNADLQAYVERRMQQLGH
jgi:MSHA biogenesis protein MshN